MTGSIDIQAVRKVHFIGAGGIGVSALALMFLALGKRVSGSDLIHSQILENLRMKGVEVAVGHRPENVGPGVDLVVYTIAADDKNPELTEAKKRKLPLLSYPEALGLLTKEKKTIAVAGTHGKTTTTSMLADIFIAAGKDPSVVVGSLLSGDRGNFIGGKSNILIAEACEYRDSFLNLAPFCAVITNIDNDHLDYFGDLAHVQESFASFAEKIPKGGFLVARAKDEILLPVLSRAKARVVDYTEEQIDYPLQVIGAHNKENAQAAAVAARACGVSNDVIRDALQKFSGTWRRQEYKGETARGALVYDDYAHHPTEIRKTIEAFKEAFPEKTLWVVFQPHLFSRTKLLLEDFARALSSADRVVVTDIYAAREKEDPSVHSRMLAERVSVFGGSADYLQKSEHIAEKLRSECGAADLILTMGAGDIGKVSELLVTQKATRTKS